MTVVKIKSMLQDIELSKEINSEFQKYLEKKKFKTAIELSMSVLTQGCWPENEAKKSNIPQEVEPLKSEFEKFYQNKYPGKVLTWTLNLGDCEMVGNFDKKKYLFMITNIQMSVLLIFNQRTSIKYEEIKHLVGGNEADLEQNVLSLCTKNEILKKSNKEIKVI